MNELDYIRQSRKNMGKLLIGVMWLVFIVVGYSISKALLLEETIPIWLIIGFIVCLFMCGISTSAHIYKTHWRSGE